MTQVPSADAGPGNHLEEVLLAAAGIPAAFGLTVTGPSTLTNRLAEPQARSIFKTEVS